MDKLKTIELKNKKGEVLGTYVEVHERVRYFRQSIDYYGWSLVTDIVHKDEKSIMMQAKVLNQFGIVVAVGTAMERSNSNFINETSHVENCETSAWGRAMACLGIGVTEHVRSKEEMENALLNVEFLSDEQAGKIWQLIHSVDEGVSQNIIAKIYHERHKYTPERAQQCIDYLESNQIHPAVLVESSRQRDIGTATKKAVDKDDFYEEKKKVEEK